MKNEFFFKSETFQPSLVYIYLHRMLYRLYDINIEPKFVLFEKY